MADDRMTKLDVISPDDFKLIGRTLNGVHWQADVAYQIGCSKSQVTRYLKKSPDPRQHRELDPLISKHLQYLINERIEQLASLMALPGMPYSGTDLAEEVYQTIVQALEKVPGKYPPRRDTSD